MFGLAIDKSIEIAVLRDQLRPGIGIEFTTWGPPFFGWGNIRMSPDSRGELIDLTGVHDIVLFE